MSYRETMSTDRNPSLPRGRADSMAKQERASLERAPSLEALGAVVGRFAHDFGNLLATIMLNLSLLEKKTTDPAVLGLAAGALRAADRGAGLANRLLAFAGKQQLTRVSIDTNLLLSGMRDLLARNLGPSVELVLRRAEHLWPASLDADQIEFALGCLAENGRAAMPAGGQLTIETANARIPERTPDLAAGDYVVIAVEDTGEGPSGQALEHAFEPFFTTRRDAEHPGLGLSTVLGIAKAHHGTARLMRAAAGGCRVEIYLPRAPSGDTHVSGEPDTARRDPRRPETTTVLVVDDDPDLRAVAEDGLKSLGCNVLLAEGGVTALEMLASPLPVDLLLADVRMADMNGLELVRRAREVRPGLRALIMTGGVDVPEHLADPRRTAILRKPFRAADLAKAIAAVAPGNGTATQ